MKNSAMFKYTSRTHGICTKGTHNIRVKAVRYGYKESIELKGNFILK